MAINSPETGNHGCEQSLTRLWKKCTSATRKTQVCQIKNTSCSFLTWKFAFLHLLEETTFKSIRIATMSIVLHSSVRFLTNEMRHTYHNYHMRRKYLIFGVSTEHWATHSSLMQRKVSTLIINSPCLETELTRFPLKSIFTFFTFTFHFHIDYQFSMSGNKINKISAPILFHIFHFHFDHQFSMSGNKTNKISAPIPFHIFHFPQFSVLVFTVHIVFKTWFPEAQIFILKLIESRHWRQLRPNEIAVAINN